MKLSVITWLLGTTLLISGCASTKPEIKYVERIVEVLTESPPQLVEPCEVSNRSGDRVRDYIIAERHLRNDLAICNLKIEARNKNERMEGMEYPIKK